MGSSLPSATLTLPPPPWLAQLTALRAASASAAAFLDASASASAFLAASAARAASASAAAFRTASASAAIRASRSASCASRSASSRARASSSARLRASAAAGEGIVSPPPGVPCSHRESTGGHENSASHTAKRQTGTHQSPHYAHGCCHAHTGPCQQALDAAERHLAGVPNGHPNRVLHGYGQPSSIQGVQQGQHTHARASCHTRIGGGVDVKGLLSDTRRARPEQT